MTINTPLYLLLGDIRNLTIQIKPVTVIRARAALAGGSYCFGGPQDWSKWSFRKLLFVVILVGDFFMSTFIMRFVSTITSFFQSQFTRSWEKACRIQIGWKNDQLAGLTSILLLTRIPGFALFANSVALSRAAWERTVPDSVISFLSAIAFTLRSAILN